MKVLFVHAQPYFSCLHACLAARAFCEVAGPCQYHNHSLELARSIESYEQGAQKLAHVSAALQAGLGCGAIDDMHASCRNGA